MSNTPFREPDGYWNRKELRGMTANRRMRKLLDLEAKGALPMKPCPRGTS